jgi:hypothetical protein
MFIKEPVGPVEVRFMYENGIPFISLGLGRDAVGGGGIIHEERDLIVLQDCRGERQVDTGKRAVEPGEVFTVEADGRRSGIFAARMIARASPVYWSFSLKKAARNCSSVNSPMVF